MLFPSSAQHQESVPLLSVHLVSSATTSRNVSDSINTSCSGTSDLPSPSAQEGLISPDEFIPTFSHTPVSPNSGPYFSTPSLRTSQSPTSRTDLPRLDMNSLQSTFGQLPITPVSASRPSDFEQSAAHGQDLIMHGYLSPSTPGRADLSNFSRDQPATSTDPNGTVLVEGNDNRKRGFASDLSGMLPTPISPSTTSGRTTPVQAIDLTDWITRSYGLDPIAGGAFGNVWKCTYDDGTICIPVAVKGFRFQVNKQTSKKLRREMGIWRRLSHPNVMEFMGYAFGFGVSIALVARWAANGTLTDCLEKSWPIITIAEQLNLLDDIASGLTYLHSYPNNPVTHGDLTGSNVLILADMTACIADFGLSSMLGDLQTGTTYLAATAMYPGAVRWTAPELLLSDDVQPTTLSDIYSLGSIMLQVLSGKVPWHETKREVIIIQDIHHGNTPPCPSHSPLVNELWPFIRQCWSLSPASRPTAGTALEFIRHVRIKLLPSPVVGHDAPSTVPHSASSPGPGPSKKPRLTIIT
ncbi:kinase-like domain-containing protein [Suillus clintonianus]|uniref:kinase-like domain-containing protein n=1 Tax=Suillus clintonianus TaxID=1904413 RepID=UPI001B86F366|nr:kinase-like domain-containing protein [Suillus clintonianus]KAG2144269.1 kinase-like domain-containing protein [Suillus clintonianus]